MHSLNCVHELKGAVDGVICLPNQKLFKLIDEKTSMVETFAITHELLAQGVRGIWRLLMRPRFDQCRFRRPLLGDARTARGKFARDRRGAR